MNIYWIEFGGVLLFAAGWMACKIWNYLGEQPMSNRSVSRMIADTAGSKYDSYTADVRGDIWDLKDHYVEEPKPAPKPEPEPEPEPVKQDAVDSLINAKISEAQRRAEEWAKTRPPVFKRSIPAEAENDQRKHEIPLFGSLINNAYGQGWPLGFGTINNKFPSTGGGGFILSQSSQPMVYKLTCPPGWKES